MPHSHLPLFSCVDLFAGCGGNSWGMLQSNGSRPLTPLLALDAESIALATYHWNMPTVELLLADIRTVSSQKILHHIGIKRGELGCLVASPPCQTYSRNNRLPKNKNDYRNTLYEHTLRMIEGIYPWVVFMENVPEMEIVNQGLYHIDFLERLEKLGYQAQHWTINAANYGVPQHRNRLIYLAYRKEMDRNPRCPVETHGSEPNLQPWVTVGEAIADLPRQHAGQKFDSFLVDDHQLLNRSAYALARRPLQSQIVFNHASRPLNSTQLLRLASLQEGQAYNDLPKKLKPKKGYKASYGRLWQSKPAQTLTTFLAYPSCGRFSHYNQDRVITIREALRIQSFDDDFRVLGNLVSQSSQVGNAVPPLIAAAFKNVIVADLEQCFGINSQGEEETLYEQVA